VPADEAAAPTQDLASIVPPLGPVCVNCLPLSGFIDW
jgi:hypothetical protein